MKQAELKVYRAFGERFKHSHRSAKMVLALCDEVERLTAVADERNGNYGDYTLLTFGKHKGKRLMDIPDDYLRWWVTQNDRDSARLDAEYSAFPKRAVARQQLKLHDYIAKRFTNGA